MPHDGYDRIPIALVALLALCVGVGLFAARFAPRVRDEGPRLPDLANAHLVEVRDAAGRTVLSGEFRERVDPLGNITRDAALVDRRGRTVVGEIEINVPGPNAMNLGQEVEIDIIDIAPNEKHSLFIDDREVATFTTDDRGSVDMQLQDAPAGEAPGTGDEPSPPGGRRMP